MCSSFVATRKLVWRCIEHLRRLVAHAREQPLKHSRLQPMRTALFLALLSLASANLSVTYHTDPSCSSPPSPFPATPPASPFDSVGSALVFADGGECLQTSSAGLFHVFGDCDSTGSVTFNWYQTRLHNPSAGCPAAAGSHPSGTRMHPSGPRLQFNAPKWH